MRVRLVAWLVLVALAVSAVPALAWGTGAHAVIALEVAKAKGVTGVSRSLTMQAVYGSGAPDIAWVAWDPLSGNLGTATHFAPGYLEPWQRARTQAQRAFALGWLSHNNVWGADYWAHSASPFGEGDGYVINRAAAAALLGVPAALGEGYVEAAIDLLLDQQSPEYNLGSLISSAASARASGIPDLLSRCYSDVPGSNWLAIRTVETTYRAGTIAYGTSLALPIGADDAALAAALATANGVSVEDSARYLETAKLVCLDPFASYSDAIAATVQLVADGPWPVG